MRQVEAEGNAEQMYGKGTELVFPEPAFVVKTIKKGSGQRMYINVCVSDKVRCEGQHGFCSMSHTASASQYRPNQAVDVDAVKATLNATLWEADVSAWHSHCMVSFAAGLGCSS